MKIVVDVNIILSALIKDSITRRIIVDSGFEFYFPENSLHKIRKYQNYIIEKSGMGELEYNQILTKLLSYIKMVPIEELLAYWSTAKEIMEKIDSEDVVFIASSLAIPNSIIWSNDSDFDKQNKVKVLKTKDILELFLH